MASEVRKKILEGIQALTEALKALDEPIEEPQVNRNGKTGNAFTADEDGHLNIAAELAELEGCQEAVLAFKENNKAADVLAEIDGLQGILTDAEEEELEAPAAS
jgi:hypothetical protein